MGTKTYKTVFYVAILMVAIFVVLIVCEWQYNQRHTVQLSQYMRSIPTVFVMPRMNRWKLVQFGSFIGIPNFYIKHGEQRIDPQDNILTICSICSLNLLKQARTIATNYKSGPLSFAIYIDRDIHSHSMHSQLHLTALLDDLFDDIPTRYNIYIGLIYANKSSPFYVHLNYTDATEMAWKLPINAMRNLAEYQVKSKWLMTVDIDYEMYSNTINNATFMHQLLTFNNNIASNATTNDTIATSDMTEIIDIDIDPMPPISYVNDTRIESKDKYSDHTLFIVPSFATVPRYINEKGLNWNDLSKKQLVKLVNGEWIWQYYRGAPYHNCTNYEKWYATDTDFELIDYMKHCERHYEPNFIIKTNVSRHYEWDNNFTGHFLDRIQRVQYLRHHKFNGIVMADLFMIHANRWHMEGRKEANHTRNFYKINLALLQETDYHI